ncbi:anti-sigma factor [Corynebacterium sp. 320]|uniref:zf-HC2 domain-containing protein n=1 Tax=Corynebacterium TaxID=1716 RepID=UPI00125CBE81|nr:MULTISPECIES: anti-sigma factor [Corynebacterium]KAB1503971.1 anti-sigma factor [Corynebacterium sp. 320]KAB1552930.1 anti-sigma factor [Corynebacterium sp. 321]KAB1553850.1 anti-sigma factor [Corynebacterium sp. 319]KAB3528107.1 anti-sigma factor [Corynebacterium sp. 250]KAB3540405.1 anti-sigma factor [Corynebacterium sp. 366]
MDGLSIEHLSPEAIAALVDGELTRKAEHRAKIHLVHCKECRDEVNTQREAAQRLRDNTCPMSASGTLIERLNAIPATYQSEAGESERDKHHNIGTDGRRKPETLPDAVDLLLRKLGTLLR